MLEREISEKLKLWRTQKNKKALCIIGARQIGKTTIIREFAKQEYENFIEINFILRVPRKFLKINWMQILLLRT